MATKIGYVSQPPASQINWAEVGANFTGMLNEEARVREEKKAEIDRATREQMKVLQNMPTGDSKNVNEWALKYGGNAQNYLLMLNASLKSGRLKPTEYTIMRQNLSDGTDLAMSVSQEYQNEYAAKMERLKSNDPNKSSQELEIYLMQTVEGFGNFNQSELIINPNTGNVAVGFMNPTTGKIESDPNKLVGINNLRNRIRGEFNKYDMNSAVLSGKESFGKFETIVRKVGSRAAQGTITTISDPTFRNQAKIDEWVKKKWITQDDAALISTFDKTEDAWLEGQLSMYNTTSLLTDNLRNIGGQKFNFTFDPNQQNDNTILLKQVDGNVVPDFESAIGKKQRQIAKDGLRTVLRGAIDHTEKVTTVSDFQEKPEHLYKRAEDTAAATLDLSMLGKLYYGTPTEIEAARLHFQGISPNIVDVQRDATGVTVKYKDAGGNTVSKTINFKASGNTLNTEEFIIAAAPLLSGQAGINAAMKSGGYEKGRAFNTTTDVFHSAQKLVEAAQTPEQLKAAQQAASNIDPYGNPIVR
jgi:hypothetical protein